jgi:photosystem II stability/assembly factor-like uncharacterized protein
MNRLPHRVTRRLPAVLLVGLAAGLLWPSGWSRNEAAAPARPKAKAAKPAHPEPDGSLPADWIKPLTWRSIGPASMGGRITAFSVYEADPSTYWVATASGGLLKTANNGVTFEHQFDKEATVSVGDVCVAPSDRNVVWVGTGEANPRNSVSYGDGVYKSTDGGKTWKNMGLKKSFQVGRIVIHPKNPDVVYVGALGRLYGPGGERGLYKTTDGGKTWERVLHVDDKTGVIDVRMHPSDPDTLLVATYERQRDGYDTNDPAKKWGPGSGLHKTTDGGKTWKKLTRGLPTCNLGRIGLDYFRKGPNIVYAVVESEKIGMGPPRPRPVSLGLTGRDLEDAGARVTSVAEKGPADRAGLKVGDVIVGVGGKAVRSYADLVENVRGLKVGDKVKVQFVRAGKKKEAELTLTGRPAGGRGPQPNPRRPWAGSLGGQEANVQDQQGRDGFQSGGVYRSTDGGESWARVNSYNPRPMYFSQIRVDPADSQRVYVLGIRMARSDDGGKTFRFGVRGVHPDQHALWIDPKDGRHMLVGTDGGFYSTYDRMRNWDHHNNVAIGQFYHVAVDTRPLYRVYGGLQDNGSWGGPSRLRGAAGPTNEDWVRLGGGDGFRCAVDPDDPDLVYFEMQHGRGFQRRNLRTGESALMRPPRPPGGARFRFNWNSPFILSHRNPKVYYCAGNYVFRSLDRGDDPRTISPEITRTSQGSATALAESPRNPDVLWAGTDDGNLWVTRDGGARWANVAENVKLPGPRWVASIEASRFKEGRAYVVFDAHRSDDDNPYVYVTEDFGRTWKPITSNLPWGSTRVLREDIENEDLLYLGAEFGAWVSLNRGAWWTKFNNNLPTVAVHEFAQHPTAGEVVAATHGRSLWVLDVTPLRQMKAEVFKGGPHLYRPAVAVRRQAGLTRGWSGRAFVGENPPAGAQFYYSLPRKAGPARLRVLDIDGNTVAQLQGPGTPGLHKLTWDLTRGGRAAGRGGRGGARPPPPVPAGSYRVVLTVDGKELAQSFRVEGEPGADATGPVGEDED